MSVISIAVFGVVALVTLLGRASLNHPVLSRFRALLPAWRFFDRAVHGPALWIRTVPSGAWTQLPTGSRPRGSALFAPAANLTLAYQACVDQLVAELGELDVVDAGPGDGVDRDPRVTSLVSYELVARIARIHGGVQWKIVVADQPGDYILSDPSESAA